MTLARRKILAGIAALPFSLPLLEVTREANAQSVHRKKRVILIHSPNGTVTEHMIPRSSGYFGRGARQLGTQVDLAESTILEPLAPYQQHLLVLTGLDFPGRAEHRAYPVMACTTHNDATSGFDTIDQRMADLLGDGTAIRSVNLAVPVNSGSLQGNGQSYSARSGRRLPFLLTARDAFNTMFGNFSKQDDGPDPRLEDRQRIIDFMNQRVGNLVSQVGTDDRRRIEWHLDALAELERRLHMAGTDDACEIPDPNGIGGEPATSAFMLRLAVMGFACNVTNVVNFGWGRDASDMIYRWVRGRWSSVDGRSIDASESAIGTGHHGLSHNSGVTGPRDRRKASMIAAIDRWHAGEIARLIQELRDVDNGDGSTLLDDTTIIWFNENRDGNHSRHDIHAVVAGHGAGWSMGRMLRLSERPMSDWSGEQPNGYRGTPGGNLWLSLLQAHGSSMTGFGLGTTGRIDELWG